MRYTVKRKVPRYVIEVYTDASYKKYEDLPDGSLYRMVCGVLVKTSCPKHISCVLQNAYKVSPFDCDIVIDPNCHHDDIESIYHHMVILDKKHTVYATFFSEAIAMMCGLKQLTHIITNTNIRCADCVLHTDNQQLFGYLMHKPRYDGQTGRLVSEIELLIKKVRLLGVDVNVKHTLRCDNTFMRRADVLSRTSITSVNDLKPLIV